MKQFTFADHFLMLGISVATETYVNFFMYYDAKFFYRFVSIIIITERERLHRQIVIKEIHLGFVNVRSDFLMKMDGF